LKAQPARLNDKIKPSKASNPAISAIAQAFRRRRRRCQPATSRK
jgi:uncharacterized membrane protein YtjA (UPF0391 family)